MLGDQDQNAEILNANVNGEEKLVVKVKGAGLWGPIWGWVSINKDGETVYGTFFNHEGETAGLGALIAEQPFQDSFRGKKVFAEGASEVTLSVVKKGKQGDLAPENYVDGITGATLTSNGVDAMLKECLIKVVKTNAEAEHDCANHKDGEPCTSPNPCEKCKQQMGK